MPNDMAPIQSLQFASTGPQGHRGRMRARLLAGGPGGLADYEILEMLLFLSIPRRDTKPLAKSIINQFGSLFRALTAGTTGLRGFGLEPATIGVFDLVREAARRLASAEAVSRPLLNDYESVTAYLDLPGRLRRPAHTAILFLNNRNQLLTDMAFPAADSPADIARTAAMHAVQTHATAMFLATFCPGPRSDDRDEDLTRRVHAAGRALSITLHDHMIFGAGWTDSFRRMGLI